MKYLVFAVLIFFSINLFFSSCKKDNCDNCGENLNLNDDTTAIENTAGPLRITVRIGTTAGDIAKGAIVKLAYTLDSINSEKYLVFRKTDSTGIAVFPDLPVDATSSKKSYFANAFYVIGSDTLSSTNGNGSNGPLVFEVTKNISTTQQLIVTYK